MTTPLNYAVPRSAVPGQIWPALPNATDANCLALLYQLEYSQYWPLARLHAVQGLQLGQLLAHALEHSPWWRRALREMDPALSAEALRSRGLSLALLQNLPILERDALQRDAQEIHCTQVPPEHGQRHLIRSSGSTGRPVEVWTTAVIRLYFRALNLRLHLWHQRDFSARVAAIRVVSEAERDARQPQSWVPGYPSGPMALCDIRAPVSAQLDWLLAQNPDYLLTYPSNLEALLLLARQRGATLPRLRQIATMAENLAPHHRALARAVWGVPIVDSYSCREAGLVALQCPQGDHYHVMSESVLVEVVDDQGRPSPPGQTGRIVVTDLHNFATPVIRYAAGDYGTLSDQPCACGRTLPVLASVAGRSRNMMHLPDGERIWPRYNSDDLARYGPVRAVQVVQTALDHLEAVIEVARPPTPEEEIALKQALVEHLPVKPQVTLRCVERIERSAGGKFEDFRSELNGAAN